MHELPELDAFPHIHGDPHFPETIAESGAVVGAVVEHDGRARRVRARRGVVLAAGGFARNKKLRARHQPVTGEWSSTAGGDTGDAIEAGVALGAATALMDDAWWRLMFLTARGRPLTCLWERSLPGAIIVDKDGQRFVNESTSYVDVGHAVLERNAVPRGRHADLGPVCRGEHDGDGHGANLPGPGGTLGPAIVFGYLATKHIAGNDRRGQTAGSSPRPL